MTVLPGFVLGSIRAHAEGAGFRDDAGGRGTAGREALRSSAATAVAVTWSSLLNAGG